MTVLLPASVFWLLNAASNAGVPVGEILGASTHGWAAALRAVVAGSATGQPMAQLTTRILLGSCVVALASAAIVRARARSYGRIVVSVLMLSAFVALGSAEWVREDLRKPYVIGGYMFANGVRLPAGTAGAQLPVGAAPDAFTVEALNRMGVLRAAAWTRLPGNLGDAHAEVRVLAEGAEIFRLECSSCHTIDGYLAIRPLVRNVSPAALDAMIGRLAAPEGGTSWSSPGLVLRTWRNRRMPPFVGTREERRELAVYLAHLGGAPTAAVTAFDAEHTGGAQVFNENCIMCHGPDGDFPFDAKGRSADALYDLIGRLPAINDAMPPLEATDVQRRALAEYLATLPAANKETAR
jgi:mono/diheme cytochrome c family protein